MIYLLIALFASLIGAISGLGGGVIIKPLLDLVSDFGAATISVLSAFTVLAMSAASLSKHILYKTKIEFRIGITLSVGAFVGGYLGNNLFDILLRLCGNADIITLLQNIILSVLLVAVLLYMNVFRAKKTFCMQNPFAIMGIGLCLGTISSFIGIGGGPINMVVLTLLFSMPTKKAAVNSLLLIMFSQASKLLTISLTTGFHVFDLNALWLMVPAGILGGLVGAWLNKKLPSQKIVLVFNITNMAIIGVSMFNSIRILYQLIS